MKSYWSNSRDAADNLSYELYLLKETNYDSVLFYMNKPSIVTGRLQVPFAELNCVNLFNKGIPVYRRHSGGGTVFHDLGNLNFAFITSLNSNRNNYLYFNSKIINVLNRFGIPDLESRENNIFCKDHKISGSAQYKFKNRLLHHGTLLVNTNLQEMSCLLESSASYSSLAVKSRHSKIVNIGQYFENGLSTTEIIFRIIDKIVDADKIDPIAEVGLTHSDISKYKEQLISDDWIYHTSPFYRYYKRFLFRNENYVTSFEVTKGIISNFRIEGSGMLTHLNLEKIYHTINNIISAIRMEFSDKITNSENRYLITQFV